MPAWHGGPARWGPLPGRTRCEGAAQRARGRAPAAVLLQELTAQAQLCGQPARHAPGHLRPANTPPLAHAVSAPHLCSAWQQAPDPFHDGAARAHVVMPRHTKHTTA